MDPTSNFSQGGGRYKKPYGLTRFSKVRIDYDEDGYFMYNNDFTYAENDFGSDLISYGYAAACGGSDSTASADISNSAFHFLSTFGGPKGASPQGQVTTNTSRDKVSLRVNGRCGCSTIDGEGEVPLGHGGGSTAQFHKIRLGIDEIKSG